MTNPNSAAADELWRAGYGTFGDAVVVLDDDPTGTQTVHDVRVYSDWEPETFKRAFSTGDDLFFVLTNSRSFSAEHTAEVHRQIAHRVAEAAREARRDFTIISRGDSTLRGHYPLEDETLCETLEAEFGVPIDGEVICPAFFEGGRYTVNDVHYLRQGDKLVPVGDTEFAHDATFGYRASNLIDYVVEKSGGRVGAANCTSVTLEELRALDLDSITAKLVACHDFGKIIVNAVDYTDLKVFATCFARARAIGKRFICRSAASLPKVLGNISDRPLLMRTDVVDASHNAHGGLVVVGSHIKLSTSQLERLCVALPQLMYAELDVHRLMEVSSHNEEIERLVGMCEDALSSGRTTVIYTTRELVAPEGFTKEQKLALSVMVSQGLTSIVARLETRPRYLVAKGGITSSDIATKGLGIREALVLGQMSAGVPVWRALQGTRFPGLPYLIFPGNVGTEDTLRDVVAELEG